MRKGDLERLEKRVKELTAGIQTPDLQFTFADGTKSTYAPMEAVLTAIEHSGDGTVKQVVAVANVEKHKSIVKLLNAILYGHQPDDVIGADET